MIDRDRHVNRVGNLTTPHDPAICLGTAGDHNRGLCHEELMIRRDHQFLARGLIPHHYETPFLHVAG
jgi:hypothetical protein